MHGSDTVNFSFEGDSPNDIMLIIGEELSSYEKLAVENAYKTIQLNCSVVVSLCTVAYAIVI